LHEALAGSGDERRCFLPARIDVEVVAASSEPGRANERITLGVNTKTVRMRTSAARTSLIRAAEYYEQMARRAEAIPDASDSLEGDSHSPEKRTSGLL
jgi:hypothetical protein